MGRNCNFLTQNVVLPVDKTFEVEIKYSYNAKLVPYNIACGI